MKIPIGFRKKFKKIKLNLQAEFDKIAKASDNPTASTSQQAILVEAEIETVSFNPEPGSYPSVSK